MKESEILWISKGSRAQAAASLRALAHLPSHVHQRVGMLDVQLAELE